MVLSLKFEVRSSKFETPTSDKDSDLALRLAPNPATTEVQIWVESAAAELLTNRSGDLTVFDARGRVVHQSSIVNGKRSTIDLSEFPAGLYFVTLRSEGTVLTKHLVVSRL